MVKTCYREGGCGGGDGPTRSLFQALGRREAGAYWKLDNQLRRFESCRRPKPVSSPVRNRLPRLAKIALALPACFLGLIVAWELPTLLIFLKAYRPR